MPRAIFLLTALTAALVLSAGVVVSIQTPARAHDHAPPKTVLKKGERELQRGRLGTYCWIRSAGDGGFVGECVDALPSYPAPDRVEAGSRLHIRILKTQRPESFSVTAYREVDESGLGIGRGQRLPVSVRRVVKGGRTVAWDVFFEVNAPDRHYYLATAGIWKDVQGSGDNQDASWAFHVKTRS